MKNYRIQDGCYNCKNVLCRLDTISQYCNEDKTMPFTFWEAPLEILSDYALLYREQWGDQHAVLSNGICDCYEKAT